MSHTTMGVGLGEFGLGGGPGFDFFSRGGSSLNWGFGLWIALSTCLHTDSMVPRYVVKYRKFFNYLDRVFVC